MSRIDYINNKIKFKVRGKVKPQLNNTPSNKYIMPIRIGWGWRMGNWKCWFQKHSWQIGWDCSNKGIGIYGTTYHLGPIKLLFGCLKDENGKAEKWR